MSVNQTYGLCEIKKMTIVSHNDFELDIFSAYRSLSIYEDLFSPSITARLTLEDVNGILNFLPVIGQETVNISYVTQGLTEAIELEMIVNKITDLENDVGTQTYNLELVSVDMITNFEQRISEYFEGSSTEIAEKCFQRLESKKTFEFEPSEDKYDEELGVIIPNMTPMKAISFLCGKAFHEEYKSSSYMFYETSKKYVMKPMEMLIEEEPKNEFNLGSYKNAGVDGKDIVDANVENKKAITYKFLSNFSVLDNITNGVFASKVSTVDMLTRNKTDLEHSMWEDHEEYKYLNYDKDNKSTSGPIFDVSGKGKQYMKVDEDTSVRFIVPEVEIKEGRPMYNQEKIFRQRLFYTNLMNNIKCEMSIYGDSDLVVGDTVNLTLPLFTRVDMGEEWKDKYYSGKYLITGIRHILAGDQYTTDLELVKDSFNDVLPSKEPVLTGGGGK
tara:strand:+ start:1148 stop:2476 length:1329 start_codon:yes stop_codon:yes gene_type:complete